MRLSSGTFRSYTHHSREYADVIIGLILTSRDSEDRWVVLKTACVCRRAKDVPASAAASGRLAQAFLLEFVGNNLQEFNDSATAQASNRCANAVAK